MTNAGSTAFAATLRAKAELERRRRTKERLAHLSEDDSASNLLTWVLKNRPLLGPGKPFNVQNHLYLSEIYQDNCPDMIVEKAGQVGVSEYLVSWGLWSADMCNCNVLYVFPNGGLVSDFSSARIGPALDREVSPYLANIVSGGEVLGKATDRVGLKRIRDRHLYLRGAVVKPDGKAPQLKSIDADRVILDEYDEIPAAAVSLAMQRMGHSQSAGSRVVSTPTYSTVGINNLYLKESDCRRWFIRCEHCGNKQPLELIDMVLEFDILDRPIKWNIGADGQPCLVCRKCKKELNRLAQGEWVVEHPERTKHGYHLSRLFMAHKPLMEIITGLQSLDETVRRETYNQGLGLPYKSRTSLSLTEEILDKCVRNYGVIKGATDQVYMGVDIGSVLHVVIREIRPGFHLVRYVGTVSEFEELDYLMTRYHVRVCVVDALPETRKAREFQRRFDPGMVWVAYYQELKKTDPSETWDINQLQVNADRTRTLDTTLAGFLNAANHLEAESIKSLPPSIRSVLDYYRHLTSLERVLQKRADGNQAAVYIGEPDHYGHAENYCDIAIRCPYGASWSRGQG